MSFSKTAIARTAAASAGPIVQSAVRRQPEPLRTSISRQDAACGVAPSWDFTAVPLLTRGRPMGLQTKLTVGESNDPLEAEADHAADRVMRMVDPAAMSAGKPSLQRKCETCEHEDEGKLARAPSNDAVLHGGGDAPDSVHDTLRTQGAPLTAAARAFFEPRFGQDFSRVRVHTDSAAAESAQSVGARAYTVGNHIVFGANQFGGHAGAGGRLLAHELAHTIQQQGGAAARSDSRNVVQRLPHHRPRAPDARPHLGSCHPAQDDLRPTAPWADLQRHYSQTCGSAASDVLGQAGRALGDIWNRRTPQAPHLPNARNAVDCACANLDPVNAARTAMAVVLAAGPLAASLFWHFLGASGSEMTIDVAAMIRRSAGVRAKILHAIGHRGMSGTTRIEQSEFGVRELQFAYGAIDCVQWQVDPSASRNWRRNPNTPVHVSMLDYYEFHPGRLGVSQCAHAACVECVARGQARNFWTRGEATVPLHDLR